MHRITETTQFYSPSFPNITHPFFDRYLSIFIMTLNQQLSSRVLAIKCNDNLLMEQSATKSIEIYQFPNTGISIVIKRVLSSLSRLQRTNVRLIENNMNKFQLIS